MSGPWPTEKVTPETKRDFYSRWLSGEFGNRFQAWDDPAQALRECDSSVFILRSKTPGGPFVYASRDELLERCADGNSIVSLEAPDHRRTFQGEATWAPDYDLQLYAAIGGRLKMREDLAQNGRHWHGVEASMLLRHYMWPSDYDDLIELSLAYPHCIVEFTCFDCAVGNCRGRNTVFWEVRAY